MTEPLDALRVMRLVADAMEMVMAQQEYSSAAATLVQQHRPSRRELSAARRENLEVHGGGASLRLAEFGVRGRPVPPEILRLRNAIDEVLAAAEILSPPA
jgi:hypothetical protein